MSHHCKALVISCMDFRLHTNLHQQMLAKYESFDLVHLAGGASTLLKPETKDVILHQIELSQKLHAAKTVVLVNHWDCGAYGGSAAFNNNANQERAQYLQDLTAAANIVKERYPDLEVVKVLQPLEGEIEIIA